MSPEGDIPFQTLVERAPDGIFLQVEGVLVYVNAAGARLLGGNQQEIQGRPVLSIVHPEDRAAVAERIRRLNEGKEAMGPREVRLLRPDGSFVAVESSAVPWSQGGQRGALVFLRDISERKDVERRLHETETRYRARLAEERDFSREILNTARVMIVVVGADERVALANRETHRVLRHPEGTLLGRSWFDVALPASIREQSRAAFHRGLVGESGDAVRSSEHPLLTCDGEERIVSWQESALREAGGTIWAALGCGEDVTERRRMERALLLSENRLRLAAETSGIGLWDWSLRTNEVWWDRRSRELFWLGPDTPLDLATFENGIEPEDRPMLWRKVEEAMAPGGSGAYDLEMRLRSPDGRHRRWVEGHGRVQHDGGVPVRVIGTVLDITWRKENEANLRGALEQLEESNRRRTEFLATLSHELRNPLAPIRNSLALLHRSPAGSATSQRALAVIDRQTGYLARLTEDLLDVTRIARGKSQLRREPVEMGGLVSRTLEDFESELEVRGIHLERRLSAAPIWLDADSTRIAQALGNVLGNAAKFTPRGGTIEVSLGSEGDSAVVRVRDNGVGVSPEVKAHLFEPFSQAPQDLARRQGGLGLGLVLVKGIVEQHGGSVSLDSAGAGRGTEVTIRLPQSEKAARSVAQAERPTIRHHRVLVIEDSADTAASLRDLLELDGHEVRVAFDGPSGLNEAITFRPDVILCDIGLPGMSGYDVARAIRSDETLKCARLVALTGYALPEDQARARDAGFTDHLAKPPDFEELERIIEQPA